MVHGSWIWGDFMGALVVGRGLWGRGETRPINENLNVEHRTVNIEHRSEEVASLHRYIN
jgi:hypothetical protein